METPEILQVGTSINIKRTDGEFFPFLTDFSLCRINTKSVGVKINLICNISSLTVSVSFTLLMLVVVACVFVI